MTSSGWDPVRDYEEQTARLRASYGPAVPLPVLGDIVLAELGWYGPRCPCDWCVKRTQR